MKILANSNQKAGTVFYEITLDQIIRYYSESTKNCWVRQAFIERGWDAIDFEHNLYGSAVIDDVLYMCVTDGADIIVDNTAIYPEEALEYFTIDDLVEYIQPVTDAIIKRYISEYEIKTPDFDDWAITLLNNGYDFVKLVKDCTDFDYFDFL